MFLSSCALLLACACAVVASAAQLPSLAPSADGELQPAAATRQLTGRFIHLTDMHPDTFYAAGSLESGACHGGGKSKGDDEEEGERAGYWGTAISDCDAPLTLINATFDWLEERFKGQVDFVVWTGDNARHDIDSRYPRSLPEIFRLNRYIAHRIRQTFGKVPVVASIGNNDIFPHNIMFAGPSTVTTEFLSIWKHFIPEVHLHSFARGGYYSVEAIPGQLLLVSLNTLYFYENNKAVDGCPSFAGRVNGFKGDDDPGTEQLLWLEQQLILARVRGMQVWMTGHVPATKSNWYSGCYERYGELVLSFHDTIVGHLFGHMNVDHFSFIQAEDVLPHKKRKGKKRRKHVAALPSASDDSFGSSGLVESLLAQYQALPAEHKAKERDYNVVHINPSVIPTYLPAFRIWEYNTTIEGKWRQPQDVVEVQGGNATLGWGASAAEEEVEEDDEEDDAEELATPASGSSLASFLSRYLATSLSSRRFLAYLLDSPAAPTPLKHKRRHKKKRKKGPSYPRLARHSSALSPSRHNSFLSPLAFTQYYLRLDEFNAFEGYGTEERLRQGGERPRPEWVVEYTTRRAEEVAQLLSEVAAEDGEGENAELRLWPTSVREALREGKDEKEVVERLRREDVTPYEMEDLTIGRWLKLGRKVAEGGKAWKEFRKRMFVSSKTDD